MTTDATHPEQHRTSRLLVFVVLATIVAAAFAPACAARTDTAAAKDAVRIWTINYTAHNGAVRRAYVVLPAWYGPKHNPPLPLVISPHGRGATGLQNADYWDTMPAIGGFAVINPDGMGRKYTRYSYGDPGQIDDLAKMPDFATKALPWLRIDRSRIYALGSSMGGQETLLLVARHPGLLAGAAAMDSVTDLALRYHQLLDLGCDARCLQQNGKPIGEALQDMMSAEVGGTPEAKPSAYAARSSLSQALQIATSRVPLQIWWSKDDRIVTDQQTQSGALFTAVQNLNPCAPVSAYVGSWAHSTEMRAHALLPIALSGFGLLPKSYKHLPGTVTHTAAPQCSA
jgi:poly(3-hydroxybutyrate) depolymerase